MIKSSSNASNRFPWGLILSLALNIFISNLEEVKTISDKSSQMTTRKAMNNEAGRQLQITHLEIQTIDQFHRIKVSTDGNNDEGLCLLGRLHPLQVGEAL